MDSLVVIAVIALALGIVAYKCFLFAFGPEQITGPKEEEDPEKFLVVIDRVSKETLGTIDGDPIHRYVYSGASQYEFDGVIDIDEIFEHRWVKYFDTGDKLLIGKKVYKLV